MCLSPKFMCILWWSQPSGSENLSVKPWSGVIIKYIHTHLHICMHTAIFEFDLTGKPFHGFWAFLCNYMEDRNWSKNIKKSRKKMGFSYNHMLSKAKIWKNSTYTMKAGKIMTGCLVIKSFYCILQREGWYHLTVALKLWALCEVCCRGGLPLVAGGFGTESRVVFVMFSPLFCSRLAHYMFWGEVAKAMQICWCPDRDYLTVCVVHSLCISLAPAVFAYVGNKEDLQVGAPQPVYPLNFNLRCIWISTSLCMRMDFPHDLFLLCSAHNTNFLSPVGTDHVKGSLDLEMQFH